MTNNKNFYERFGLIFNEEKEFEKFKNRTMTSVHAILRHHFQSGENIDEYLHLIGEYRQSRNDIKMFVKNLQKNSPFSPDFEETPIYKTLSEESDKFEYLQKLEAFFKLEIPEKDKDALFGNFKYDLRESNLGIQVIKLEESNSYRFLPIGEDMLDEKLIFDSFYWLNSYNKTKEMLLNTLKKYNNPELEREFFDGLRITLETFLRELFNNDKSMENQNEFIGKKLKEIGISTEIRNMFNKLVDCYQKYQNNHIKHGIQPKSEEKEFMLYLTMNFIRLLVNNSKLDDKELLQK